MSSTTNTAINSRSMNGVITISDGQATLENGDLNCDDIISSSLNTSNINTSLLTCSGKFESNLNGPYTIPISISNLTGLLISYGNVINSGATDFTNFQSNYTSTQGGFRFFNKSATQTLTNLAIIDNSQTYFSSQLTNCTAESPLNSNSIVNKTYVDTTFLDRTNNLTQSVNGLKSFSNNTNFTGSLLSRTNIKLSEYENTAQTNTVTLTFPLSETIALRTTSGTANPMTITLPLLTNNERGYVFTFNKLFDTSIASNRNFPVTFNTSGGQGIYSLLDQIGTPTINTTLLSVEKIQCKLAVGWLGSLLYWIEQTDFSTYDRFKLHEYINPTATNTLVLTLPLPPTITLRTSTISTMTITLPTLTALERGKIFTFIKINSYNYDVVFNTSGGQGIYPMNNITGTPTTNSTIFPSNKKITRLVVGWFGSLLYWVEVSDYSTFDVGINNGRYVDFTTDQTISGTKRFNGIYTQEHSWATATFTNRVQSYMSGDYLVFMPQFSNNQYAFHCKDPNLTTPLLINPTSTIISNLLVSNNITASSSTGSNNIFTNLGVGGTINIGNLNSTNVVAGDTTFSSDITTPNIFCNDALYLNDYQPLPTPTTYSSILVQNSDILNFDANFNNNKFQFKVSSNAVLLLDATNTTIYNNLNSILQATFSNFCPISNTPASLNNHLTTLGFNNGKYIDFLTDQTISNDKRFGGLWATNFNITETLGGGGNRVQISQAGTTLQFVPVYNNQTYKFYVSNATGSQIISLQTDYNNTTINNYLICNSEAYFNTWVNLNFRTRIFDLNGLGNYTQMYMIGGNEFVIGPNGTGDFISFYCKNAITQIQTFKSSALGNTSLVNLTCSSSLISNNLTSPTTTSTNNIYTNLVSGGVINIGGLLGTNNINGATTFNSASTFNNGAVFNTVLPTTSITATTANELVNYTTLTTQGFISSSTILSANNNFTGFNTFTNGLTIRSTLLLKDYTNTQQGTIDLGSAILSISCDVNSGKVQINTHDSGGASYNRVIINENEFNLTVPITLFLDYTYYNPVNFTSTRLGYSMSNTGSTNTLTNNTANNSGQINIPAGSWNITYTGTITVITNAITTLTSLEIYVADNLTNDLNIIGINVINYYKISTVPVGQKMRISGSGNYISYTNVNTELNLRLLPLFTAGTGGLNFQGKISATRNA